MLNNILIPYIPLEMISIEVKYKHKIYHIEVIETINTIDGVPIIDRFPLCNTRLSEDSKIKRLRKCDIYIPPPGSTWCKNCLAKQNAKNTPFSFLRPVMTPDIDMYSNVKA